MQATRLFIQFAILAPALIGKQLGGFVHAF